MIKEMRKIIKLIMAVALSTTSLVSWGQNTDAQNTTLFNVIRNETSPGGNTKGRIADAFEALNRSKESRIPPISVTGIDTYSASIPAYVTTLSTGRSFIISVANNNTGPSTINITPSGGSSFGAKDLKRNDGSDLEANDLTSGGYYVIVYNGVNFRVLNAGVSGGGGGGSQDLESVLTEGNDAGLNIITNLADPSGSTDAVTLGYMNNSIDAAKNEVALTAVLNHDNDGGANLIKNIANPVDPQDAATKDYVDDLVSGGGAVTSVFTRSGDVVAQSGDYTATQITNTPAGSVAATTAQAAINELDTEKQAAITFGTGVLTALGVNIGSAGAPILFNGAGGTPSSMTGTNITGIPQSGVTNLTSDLALKAPLASPALTGTPTAPTATSTTNNTQIATTAFVKAASPTEYGIACSDLTTALTTGTGKAYFRVPKGFTVTAVRASVFTAQSSGSILTIDINESGSTILSTKLTIDNTEKTSTTAATAPVISDTSLADDAEITVDIDQVGTAPVGLIVWIIGY
jgi:hypothetical protein